MQEATGGQRWRRAAVIVVTFAVAFLGWVLLLGGGLRDGRSFDYVRWEVAHLPGKWLYALGEPLRRDPAPDEALATYFALEDRDGPEARRLENTVEAAIEGRIDAALHDLGMHGAVRVPVPGVFPAVDLELTGPPRLLVVSPRTRIALDHTEALRPDLATDRLLELERETEARDASMSALVVPLGGVSTYPSIVNDDASYESTLRTSAHEWTHHYLAFFPLGVFALRSNETLTINETVADIVGDEVAAQVLERFGRPEASPPAPPPSTPQSSIDQNAVLRALRIEVDALLASGRVDEAERRMEQVREELEAGGARIRRINQAFFAWYGTYAARADSVDPLGPQVRELRARAGSLPRFLELIRAARSREDVARLIEETR